MPRSTNPMRRSRLAPMSEKRREQIPARQACVAAVIERDKGCVWFKRWATIEGRVRVADDPGHGGPLDVHEPARRSHGADPTDPDQAVALCRQHHRYAHEHPAIGRLLGLIT